MPQLSGLKRPAETTETRIATIPSATGGMQRNYRVFFATFTQSVGTLTSFKGSSSVITNRTTGIKLYLERQLSSVSIEPVSTRAVF